MNDGGSEREDVFDVRRVRRLVELMHEHELAEVDLRQGEQRIRLRRGHEPVVTMGPVPAVPMSQAPFSVTSTTPTVAVPVAADEDRATYVVSPMVGTFYTASSPDAPPFVKVGDAIGKDTIVCIIEAMKVFNEIPAECTGKIVACLVENGAAVEYGQKLFKVVPA